MAARVLCSHNHARNFREDSVPQPVKLVISRDDNKTSSYKCGSCCQTFSAICVLHVHLGGGSYHYDKDTMTAFPLDENGCPTLQYRMRNTDENQDCYCVKCGASMNKTPKRRPKFRKTQIKKSPKKRDKPVLIQYQQTDEINEEDTTTKVNVEQQHVDDTEGDAAGDDDNDDDDEHLLQSDTETKNTDGELLVLNSAAGVGSEKYGELDEAVSANKRDSTPIDFETPKHSTDVVSSSDHPTGDCGSDHQEPSTSEEARNDGAFVNKEIILDVICMETNDDGTLKLVVGERDAEIFQTPQGEEILKALKKQAKGSKLQNTQVLCSYSVPTEEHHDEHKSSVGYNIAGSKRKKRLDEKSENNKSSSVKKMKYINADRKAAEELPAHRDMVTSCNGIEPIVFMRKQDRLKAEEATEIIDECNLGLHDGRISKIQPINAKGGEVYVVDMDALPDRKDIRHDKYIWRCTGVKKLPSWGPLVRKYFFKIRLPDDTYTDEFQKLILEPIDQNRYCVVQYVGNESVFTPFPHGNNRKGTGAFRRTCPSVIAELKTLSSQKGLTPTQIYKVISSSSASGFRGPRVPRNLRQIKNQCYIAKRKEKKETPTVENKTMS